MALLVSGPSSGVAAPPVLWAAVLGSVLPASVTRITSCELVFGFDRWLLHCGVHNGAGSVPHCLGLIPHLS